MIKQPAPRTIQRARLAAGLTQKAAAEMVYRSRDSRWHEWETGKRLMPLAEWELFLFKTNQHKESAVK